MADKEKTKAVKRYASAPQVVPKIGAPTRYDPRMCEILDNTPVEMLGAATVTDICHLLGVPYKMIYDWMNRHEIFRDTVMRARDRGDQLVIAALKKRAEGFSHETEQTHVTRRRNADGELETVSEETTFGKMYVPPDTNAAKFWLSNRQRKDWADRKEVELKTDFLELVDKFSPVVIEGEFEVVPDDPD